MTDPRSNEDLVVHALHGLDDESPRVDAIEELARRLAEAESNADLFDDEAERLGVRAAEAEADVARLRELLTRYFIDPNPLTPEPIPHRRTRQEAQSDRINVNELRRSSHDLVYGFEDPEGVVLALLDVLEAARLVAESGALSIEQAAVLDDALDRFDFGEDDRD